MKRCIMLAVLLAIVALSLSAFGPGDVEQPADEPAVDLGDGWWRELADNDAAKAYQTIIKLVEIPDKAIPYLRERLLAEKLPSPQEIGALIGDLGSASFAKREAASRALEKLGPAAERTLIGRLSENPSAEIHGRIEQIWKKLASRRTTLVELRLGRALEVLERIGNVDANKTLKEVGEKQGENWLGEEARKGLARLEGHPEFAKVRPDKAIPKADDQARPEVSRQQRYRYAAISPDGKLALVTEEFDRVFLWDLSSGKVMRELASNMACGAVAWSPDGRFAASGCYTGEIELWDAKNWELLRTLPGHPRAKPGWYGADVAVFHLQFSADSQRLISAGGNSTQPPHMPVATLCHWNTATGELLEQFAFPEGGMWADDVSADGELIVYRRKRPRVGRHEEPPDIVVYNLAKRREVGAFDSMKTAIMRGTFNASGRFFLAAHAYGPRLWELASMHPVIAWEEPTQWVTFVAISPSGRQAITSALTVPRLIRTTKLWDLTNGKTIKELAPKEGYWTVFLPDGNRALSMGEHYTLEMWGLANGAKKSTLAGPYYGLAYWPCSAMAFPPEVKGLLSKGLLPLRGARMLNITDNEEGPRAALCSPGGVFAPNGKWLFTGEPALWDVERGEKVWTAFPQGETTGRASPSFRHLHCVAISRDGSFGLSGGSPMARPLRLWDLKKGKLAADLVGHKGHIRAATFSNEGQLALSRGDDKSVKLWEVPSGTLLKSFDDPGGAFSDVWFSPDDNLVYSRGRLITAWETATGKLVRSTVRPAQDIRYFAYSSDMSLGVSGLFDTDLTLWDLKSGKAIRKLDPPDGVPTPIHAIVISPDDKLVVAIARPVLDERGDPRGKQHAWNMNTGKLMKIK